MTTQPETRTSRASTSNALLLGGSPDSRGDAAGVKGNRRIERRRNGGVSGSPMDILTQLPAVVVLERLTVPSLAMARNGIILFANTAFAELVGYRRDSLAGLPFPEVFHTVPVAVCALTGIDALKNLVVELQHCEGWTVRARMSKSALMRRDDPILVTFEDLTEQLWMDER